MSKLQKLHLSVKQVKKDLSFSDDKIWYINKLNTGLVSFSENYKCQIGVFWWQNTTNYYLSAEY